MRDLLAGNTVIPVIVIDRVEDAVPLAKALIAGGLNVLEVTLRTAAAVEGIRQIVQHVPGAIVGTGTVCTADQVKLSEDLGCQFMVSPGSTDKAISRSCGFFHWLLPGISSAS